MNNKRLQTFAGIYNMQVMYQAMITNMQVPKDDPYWFLYHNTALTEERGEFLKADKRWKSHRNTRYERDEKLDEWADMLIEVMNLGIFSGFTSEEVCDIINKKIAINFERYQEEGKSDEHSDNRGSEQDGEIFTGRNTSLTSRF